MSNDIQAVKAIITATIEIGQPIGTALADGKITFSEWFPIGYAAMRNVGAINQFREAWAEARDLDEMEKAQLTMHVAITLNLPNDVAERRAIAAFKFLAAGAVFYNEWNAPTALAA